MVRKSLSGALEKHSLHSRSHLHVGLPLPTGGHPYAFPSLPRSLLDSKQCILFRRLCFNECLCASENVRVINSLKNRKKIKVSLMAGFEPATFRLTAERSTD